MQHEIKVLTLTACTLFVLCTSGTYGMEISNTRTHSRLKRHTDDDDSSTLDASSIFASKRACNGFPCMYSHLGTKAGRASLYKTLAGFIDDCFNDPACSPGRRKRQDPQQWRAEKIIKTPLLDLVQWRMRNEHP